jgi:hypothetical protein
VTRGDLSRDSWFGQRNVHALAVKVFDGLVDGPLELGDASECQMSQVVPSSTPVGADRRSRDDQRMVTLIRLMLKAVMPDGTRVAVQEGTPLGGPLPPLLSNVVLDELDSELARRGLLFVRCADDCNIFVRSEGAGQRVMTSIPGFLERRMRLEVNEEKSGVRSPEEVHFLAFSFDVGRMAATPSYSSWAKREND